MNKRSMWALAAIAAGGLVSAVSAANEWEVGQSGKRFMMNGNKIETLAIKAGDAVRFRNEDPYFHNIFSLSETKLFDLGSFPKGDSRTMVFDKVGVVDLECAIHPEMQLKLEVR